MQPFARRIFARTHTARGTNTHWTLWRVSGYLGVKRPDSQQHDLECLKTGKLFSGLYLQQASGRRGFEDSNPLLPAIGRQPAPGRTPRPSQILSVSSPSPQHPSTHSHTSLKPQTPPSKDPHHQQVPVLHQLPLPQNLGLQDVHLADRV